MLQILTISHCCETTPAAVSTDVECFIFDDVRMVFRLQHLCIFYREAFDKSSTEKHLNDRLFHFCVNETGIREGYS